VAGPHWVFELNDEDRTDVWKCQEREQRCVGIVRIREGSAGDTRTAGKRQRRDSGKHGIKKNK